MLIDTHVHLFPKFCGMRGGLPTVSLTHGQVQNGNEILQVLPPSYIQTSSTLEVYWRYMQRQKVDKAILMPNIFYGYHNDYYLEAVKKYPRHLKAVALVDVLQGELAVQGLEKLHQEGLFGLKIETGTAFQCEREVDLDDRRIQPVWQYCNDTRQFIFLHLTHKRFLASLGTLCKSYPNIRFVICHLGAEAVLEPEDPETFAMLLEFFQKHENTYAELSAVQYHFRREACPFVRAAFYIEECYRTIGGSRMIWGSDYPGICTMQTYEQTIHQICEHCKIISSDDLDRIMGQNALELFFVI